VRSTSDFATQSYWNTTPTCSRFEATLVFKGWSSGSRVNGHRRKFAIQFVKKTNEVGECATKEHLAERPRAFIRGRMKANRPFKWSSKPKTKTKCPVSTAWERIAAACD
jgi:hypothetical protein